MSDTISADDLAMLRTAQQEAVRAQQVRQQAQEQFQRAQQLAMQAQRGCDAAEGGIALALRVIAGRPGFPDGGSVNPETGEIVAPPAVTISDEQRRAIIAEHNARMAEAQAAVEASVAAQQHGLDNQATQEETLQPV